jgi:hypothetical protein
MTIVVTKYILISDHFQSVIILRSVILNLPGMGTVLGPGAHYNIPLGARTVAVDLRLPLTQ